jgi:hypothetical protein
LKIEYLLLALRAVILILAKYAVGVLVMSCPRRRASSLLGIKFSGFLLPDLARDRARRNNSLYANKLALWLK